MEQTIVDFFLKSTELILHNRLTSTNSLEANINKMINRNSTKFQLAFDQKFNFGSKIPTQWSTSNNKLLVVEFFLKTKTTNEKFLVEQWSFVLSQVSDSKFQDIIDSPNTLYKKLSVLLRSISLLTVTLPLYRHFINDKTSQLCELYDLEYSINLTKHTLTNWHPILHEERNLVGFTNPDLMLPGRTFGFKVNYAKSLNFLHKIKEEAQPLVLLKERIDPEYFNTRERGLSDGGNVQGYLKSVGKSTFESNKANLSNGGGTYSPNENQQLGEAFSENAVSPMGSLLLSSPIETQKALQFPGERQRKGSYGETVWNENNKPTEGNRPRLNTMVSQSSGEYDMYVYEDPDDKFTEIISSKEIETRNDLKTRFTLHPRCSEDEQGINELTPKVDLNELKHSTISKKIKETIIEQTDDDKIAEIIGVVDNLKEIFNLSMSGGKDNMFTMKSVTYNHSNDSTPKGKTSKGFRFAPDLENTNLLNQGASTLSSDYHDLGTLYSILNVGK